MRFDQGKQIFRLLQDGVRSDDVIGVRFQSGKGSRTSRFDFQNVPNIFGRIFERTKPNGNSQQPLTAPRVARNDRNVAQVLHFAVVQCHLDFSIQVQLQNLLQSFVVLVETRVADSHNKIKVGFKFGSRSG